jgi:hypothetical protein
LYYSAFGIASEREELCFVSEDPTTGEVRRLIVEDAHAAYTTSNYYTLKLRDFFLLMAAGSCEKPTLVSIEPAL